MNANYAAITVILIMATLASVGSAAIYVNVQGDSQSINPGEEYLQSNVTLIFNEAIPKTSWLYVYIDSESIAREEISLDRYLPDESSYEYRNQTFSYFIDSSGTNTWSDYPDQSFSYRISVRGLCGDSSCITGDETPVDLCGGPDDCGVCNTSGEWYYGSYPCQWSLSRSGFRQDTVNGDPEETGLEFMEDASLGFQIPPSADPDSLVWEAEELLSNPPEVEVTMRQACKGMSYGNSPVASVNGWMTLQLTPVGGRACSAIPGGQLEGTGCRITLGHRFDQDSMLQGYRKYGGPWYPSGGIYKNDVYQRAGLDAEWNGDDGTVMLKDFDSTAYYYMVYLPANGPMACAYTSYSVPHSEQWSGQAEIANASAGFGEPYGKTFRIQDLEGFSSLANPGCPAGVPETGCTEGDAAYSVEESYDPSGSVTVSSSFSQDLAVTATVDSKVLDRNQSVVISLADFNISIGDISEEVGNHSMRLVILDGGDTIWDRTYGLFTCNDVDKDGYCTQSGDCNDSDPDINPGANETCDGLDNNCNGQIDEGISGMGEQLWADCNNWPGSVCAGKWICNPNGTELVCLPDKGIFPGDREEVCGNRLDDDCDGTVDETYEIVDGAQRVGCINDDIWCIDGEERNCGTCGKGTSACTDGKWGSCLGDIEPGIETCNGLDDDCDGVVDNLFGKSSVEDTLCECYGGASPSFEICDGLDNDCDGDVDEGVENCCPSGNNRVCGTDTGECEFGIQTCSAGKWGQCEGAVYPEEEVCCDGLDNDCDGDVDEGCSESSCYGDINQTSMVYWAMIGIGMLILMAVLIYEGFFKSK